MKYKIVLIMIIVFFTCLFSSCQTYIPLYQAYIEPISYYTEEDNIEMIMEDYFSYTDSIINWEDDEWSEIEFIKLDYTANKEIKNIINRLISTCYNLNYAHTIDSDYLLEFVDYELSNMLVYYDYFNQLNAYSSNNNIVTIISDAIIIPNNYVKFNGNKIKTYSYIMIDSYSLSNNVFLEPQYIEYSHNACELIVYFEIKENKKYEIYQWVEINKGSKLEDDILEIKSFTNYGIEYISEE